MLTRADVLTIHSPEYEPDPSPSAGALRQRAYIARMCLARVAPWRNEPGSFWQLHPMLADAWALRGLEWAPSEAMLRPMLRALEQDDQDGTVAVAALEAMRAVPPWVRGYDLWGAMVGAALAAVAIARKNLSGMQKRLHTRLSMQNVAVMSTPDALEDGETSITGSGPPRAGPGPGPLPRNLAELGDWLERRGIIDRAAAGPESLARNDGRAVRNVRRRAGRTLP